jgi:hypothetical protein
MKTEDVIRTGLDQKGGWVFFAGDSSYVIDGVGFWGGYLVCFARFCDVLASVKRWAGSVAWAIFRIFSFMVFALQRISSIVRFWELIACSIGRAFLAGLVVCFVGFMGDAWIWEA